MKFKSKASQCMINTKDNQKRTPNTPSKATALSCKKGRTETPTKRTALLRNESVSPANLSPWSEAKAISFFLFLVAFLWAYANGGEAGHHGELKEWKDRSIGHFIRHELPIKIPIFPLFFKLFLGQTIKHFEDLENGSRVLRCLSFWRTYTRLIYRNTHVFRWIYIECH